MLKPQNEVEGVIRFKFPAKTLKFTSSAVYVVIFTKINNLLNKMETKRIEVAALIRAGQGTTSIMNLTYVSKVTVCCIRNRVADGEDLKDKPRSGRPAKLTSKAAKLAFLANQTMTMSALAKKKSVSPSTVSRAVKAAGGKSLRYIERPLLSQRQKDLRLERCG